MLKMHYFTMINMVPGNSPCIENNIKSPKTRKKLLHMRERSFSECWCLLVPEKALAELLRPWSQLTNLEQLSLDSYHQALTSSSYKLSSLKQFWLIMCLLLIHHSNFSLLQNLSRCRPRLTWWFDTRHTIDWKYGRLVKIPSAKGS